MIRRTNLIVGICLSVLVLGFSLTGYPSFQKTPASAQVHANRGVAFLEQFRFEEAATEFEAVVALEPASLAGQVNLGIAYFNQRDFEKAQTAFERAKALGPDNPHVHYNLGLIFKLMGNTEEAVSAFEKVSAHDPSDSMTLYYLGTLYANLGRLVEAEATLRKTLELQPNNESAHFSLGNILIRQGRTDEGRKELEIFRTLKESFPAEAASAGLQYTELGPYAEAIEESSPPLQEARPEPSVESAVRWVEASQEAGLDLPALPSPPAWPVSVAASRFGPDFVERRLLPHLGTGLAFRDLDGDFDPDLIFVRDGGALVFFNEGGRFRKVAVGIPGVGKFVGVTVGDVDGDGDADVYLVGSGPNALFTNDGAGRFEESNADVGGNDVSASATFADVDHDGDLDIYVSNYVDPEAHPERGTLRVPQDLVGAPNRLYRNNGNGTFTEIGAASGTAGGSTRSLGSVFSDLDDDRDIDFLVVNDGQPSQVFSNDRVGTFTESASAWGIEPPGRTRGVDSADFDRNGVFDLFFTAEGAVLNLLLRGPTSRGFTPDVVSPGLLAAGVPGARFGTTFLDADNDTDLDLLLVTNEPGAVGAFYQNSRAGFNRAGVLTTPKGKVGAGRALAAADVDGDGDLDVVIGTDRGRLLLFRNEGGNSGGGWIKVVAQGLRSNKDGLGTKVEVKAGSARLRREVRSISGYMSQNDLPMHFGLGSRKTADYIRFLWPGGVKQIEMDVEGGQTVTYEELNRKGTSCPILYTWDGDKIRFVTDFLGGAAVGYLHAPGKYNYPDTDEYIKLEHFPPRPKDGAYELRWVNQLEEVLGYDKASLVAVDHPADVDVFPNERLLPVPPYPEPRLYPVRDARPPQAVDHRGNDVTHRIAEKDRLYPSELTSLPFKGYAEPHSLTLDLGELDEGEHAVLLLYGWIDYTDSSSNLAAWQAGATVRTPYLEVEDGEGDFRMAIEQMGFPAGLPKTMLVDLEGIVDAAHRRVRITTSQKIYWDQILVATVVPDVDLRVTELAPDRAELGFRGFPASINPDGRAPHIYDYSRISTTEVWDEHQGRYTRYGDVRELVNDIDDRYVITKNGDELTLSFQAHRLPPLPDGWTRTFLVFADGFGKDMDLNSAFSDTVEPLPFHDMRAYPYQPGESFPQTEAHRSDFEKYQTRRVQREKGAPATTP